MGSISPPPPSSLLTRIRVSCPFLSLPSQIPTPFSCKRLRTRLQESRPRVSISPPPLDFDYRLQFLPESKSEVAELHPGLLDLVERGSLVLVKKSRLGSIKGDGFVEPEMIWIVGVNHIQAESAADVERVMKTGKPDNVVVELCRSRSFGGVLQNQITYSFSGNYIPAVHEEIGAQIVLGDRPMEITDLQAPDSQSQLYEKLSLYFPSLLQPLIHERDVVISKPA